MEWVCLFVGGALGALAVLIFLNPGPAHITAIRRRAPAAPSPAEGQKFWTPEPLECGDDAAAEGAEEARLYGAGAHHK